MMSEITELAETILKEIAIYENPEKSKNRRCLSSDRIKNNCGLLFNRVPYPVK